MMAKRGKRSKAKSGGKRRGVPAQLRPFLFVKGGGGKRSRKRRAPSKGVPVAKRKRSGKRRGGGFGRSHGSGIGSFFGKPVLMTVAGAGLASAFGPRIRAMLPAQMATGGGLAASAIVAFGGGFLLSKALGKEAGAGFAAGTLAAELGAMVGNIGGATTQGMRGLPGESGGVDYLPALDGYGDDLSGVGDDDLSGFESDALEVG